MTVTSNSFCVGSSLNPTVRSCFEACGDVVCINWKLQRGEIDSASSMPLPSVCDDITGMTSSPHGQTVPVMVWRGEPPLRLAVVKQSGEILHPVSGPTPLQGT